MDFVVLDLSATRMRCRLSSLAETCTVVGVDGEPWHLATSFGVIGSNWTKMTQRELAEVIGVSRQTVNVIEQSEYSPSSEGAVRNAHVFGTAIEGVFVCEPDVGAYHEFVVGLVYDLSWNEAKRNDNYGAEPRCDRVTTQQRSAVVTRHSEQAVARALAGFCKFSVRDMAARRVFGGQLGNQCYRQFGSSDCYLQYRSFGEHCRTSSEGQVAAGLESTLVLRSERWHVIGSLPYKYRTVSIHAPRVLRGNDVSVLRDQTFLIKIQSNEFVRSNSSNSGCAVMPFLHAVNQKLFY